MKSVFITAREGGILVQEFVGTKEEYKEKFLQDKKDVAEKIEKEIEALTNKEYVLTEEQKNLPEFEKKLAEIDLERKKAEDDAKIVKLQEKLKYVEEMKLEDLTVMELQPVKW